jgi:hypothetical protein
MWTGDDRGHAALEERIVNSQDEDGKLTSCTRAPRTGRRTGWAAFLNPIRLKHGEAPDL